MCGNKLETRGRQGGALTSHHMQVKRVHHGCSTEAKNAQLLRVTRAGAQT
eukprot:CAMPEP_0179335152 /NCGR_PEP_ID=MMETSP0797-20121207/66337_1 /TAXON_ID=47934 /ORGANISM="Dinophysis acuminata, Strain DAEP01" /LENGTH=49 /DNA_ID= /DNA_START= /DNA_END= /DNA_ORIENTATION=